MSNTPRTDSVERGFTADLSQNPQHRLSNLARQLERELAEAVAQGHEALEALEGLIENYKLNKGRGFGIGQRMKAKAAIAKLKGQNHE
jgi:hypothetical protein